MGLYQAAAAGLPGAQRAADRGTAWALDRLVRRDDWAAATFAGDTATGATALLVAGLDYRRQATGDERYDDVMRRLGRFLVAQTQPSGAVLAAYDAKRDAPVPGEYSKYYTGESYWALARLARTFPDDGFGAVADRIGAYLATRRDDAEGYWPPIRDHWAAYGLAETVPLSQAEVAYARRQAELWGTEARWVQQRFGPMGRRGPGARGVPRRLVRRDERGLHGPLADRPRRPRLADLQRPIADVRACIAGLAVREQADAADAARGPGSVPRARARGSSTTARPAWTTSSTRWPGCCDHPDRGDRRRPTSSSDDDAPSVWLWAVALLLALNPARAAFGIPRAGRSSREVGRLAVAGGAIGGLAVVHGRGRRRRAPRRARRQRTAAWTVAGILALLTGAADLFGRPPRPEPSLPGRRAALVPVAIPVVARPALLVIALGAENDVVVSLGAMVVGVALMTVLAVRCPTDGAGGRVLGWSARLLAAGLVACGVLIAIDGILGV